MIGLFNKFSKSNLTPMNELLVRLYKLNLTNEEVERTLLEVDTWLENKYPILSQMYRTQLLKELVKANREIRVAIKEAKKK
jgi:hypothetical protein